MLISTDKTPVIEGAIEIEADEEYEEQIDFTDAGAAMRMQVVQFFVATLGLFQLGNFWTSGREDSRRKGIIKKGKFAKEEIHSFAWWWDAKHQS